MTNRGIAAAVYGREGVDVKRYRCYAPSCKEAIATDKLFCDVHWARIPDRMRRELMSEYLAGQSTGDVESTIDFRIVLDVAVAHLREEAHNARR